MDRSMGSNKKTRQDDDDVSSDRPEVRLLMESLMETQRLADELKSYLQVDQSSPSMDPLPTLPAGGGGAGALPALAEAISESLSRAIMLLQRSQSTGRWSPLMVDHAGAKQLMLPAPAPARRGSGGYKRRSRTQLSQGCRKELRSSMDDGYSWRKYGQKEIFGAKYPRSYFRCKHKYGDQLCPATRQVQRSEADPSMLEITYIGDHTCTQKQQQEAASNTSSIIKHEDVPPFPSTEKIRRDHQAAADDHDDGPPVHLDLDGSFPYLTTSDLQMAMELDGHGGDVIFDGRYTAAGGGGGDDVDDELAAAASSFGTFTVGALEQYLY